MIQISRHLLAVFISVRASDADLWDTFVMSEEEEELWFSLFSLENLATKRLRERGGAVVQKNFIGKFSEI